MLILSHISTACSSIKALKGIFDMRWLFAKPSGSKLDFLEIGMTRAVFKKWPANSFLELRSFAFSQYAASYSPGTEFISEYWCPQLLMFSNLIFWVFQVPCLWLCETQTCLEIDNIINYIMLVVVQSSFWILYMLAVKYSKRVFCVFWC